MADLDTPHDSLWAPPAAEVTDQEPLRRRLVLATPVQRFVGFLIDSVLGNSVGFVAVFVGAIVAAAAQIADPVTMFVVMYGVGGVASLAWVVLQAFLLARRSATVGKLAVRIKIVRSTGRRASLARTFWVRMMLFYFVVMLAGLPTAFIGGLVIMLVDGLMVFSRHRRTLKDRWADTVVVQA